MIYFVLLLIAAIPAYILGSMSTMTVASVYIFRTNLKKYGKSDVWFSNFWRVQGLKGTIKLFLTELVRDAVPILFAALLLLFKKHSDVGMAFAVFCLVFGRLYPVLYDFKGTHATAVLIVGAFFIKPALGIAVLVFTAGTFYFTHYISLATVVGAVTFEVASLLLVDNKTVTMLCLFTMLLVLVKHVNSIIRILNGTEEKIIPQKDISYKLGQKL